MTTTRRSMWVCCVGLIVAPGVVSYLSSQLAHPAFAQGAGEAQVVSEPAQAPPEATPGVQDAKPEAQVAKPEVSATKGDEGAGKDQAAAERFIRVRRDQQNNPLALETSIVRFTASEGPYAGATVDLVGVVHVGEKAYYEELNKRFMGYDAVLYELVAAEGQNVPQPGERRGSVHPIGAVQMGMKNMLELEFQLDHIDYAQKNMVHADMSPTEFSAKMKDRGESFLEMFFRMMGQGMAQQTKDPGRSNDLRLLTALFSRDRARQLKQLMAQQFESMDGTMGALDGPEGSTIITERNKKAFEVLAAQLKEGKKNLAVFYGAGHLPDMQRRLEADFGMRRQGEEWLSAWVLGGGKK